jgi:Protein of unknown function (DUF4236)
VPFYIRKALTRGPIRLNLSKSGLGASLGVKGLRIGIGPKGTYVHGGRYGLYYRQYFNSPSNVRGPNEQPARQVGTTMQSTAEPLEFFTGPLTNDAVATEIGRRLSEPRWSIFVFVGSVIVPGSVALNGQGALALLLFLALLAFGLFLTTGESRKRRIELHYDLSEVGRGYYEAFVKAFEEAAGCSNVWRITTQSQSRVTKYSAGAGTLFERSPTRITFNDQTITSNLRIPWLRVAGGRLSLLPDRMLFFASRGVASLRYEDAHEEASFTNFREDGTVPGDSTNIGTTWQFVNKAGGPDRRFVNNRQIPIQRYSHLQFSHPLLTFCLQFSRANVADELRNAFRLLTTGQTVITTTDAYDASGIVP